MPDWIYIDSDVTSAFTEDTWNSASYQQYCEQVYVAQYAREQQMWTEHQQMLDEQARQAEQQAEELREDKIKYPLFFWRELCERK